MNYLFLLDSLPPDRFFGIDAQAFYQAMFNALAVIVLGIILTFILYKPVRQFLHDRTERIKGQLDEARESRVAASELRAKYDHQLKDIDVECTSILEEARKLANERSEQIISKARDKAKEERDRANKEIEDERARVRDEMYSAVVDISLEMAEKLLAASIDKKAHDRLFADGLAELDKAVFS